MTSKDDRELFELIGKNTTTLEKQFKIFKEMLESVKDGKELSSEILLMQIRDVTELACEVQNGFASLSSACAYIRWPDSKY